MKIFFYQKEEKEVPASNLKERESGPTSGKGALEMPWQDEILKDAADFGLTVTSGYRAPGHNAAIGGAPGSYHTQGSPGSPGAIDVAGPANLLKGFFDALKQAFKGRINELYLNLPGGGSAAVKNDQTLGTNPEAGRPQHLHIALRDGSSTPGKVAMRLGTDVANAGGQLGSKGEEALRRVGLTPEGVGIDQGACTAKVCLPGVAGGGCLCWSDFWAYGGGGAVVALGLWMLLGSREE